MYDEIMVNVSYKAQHPIAVVINTNEELEKNHLTYIEFVPPKGVGNMRCFPMYMAAHSVSHPFTMISMLLRFPLVFSFVLFPFFMCIV